MSSNKSEFDSILDLYQMATPESTKVQFKETSVDPVVDSMLSNVKNSINNDIGNFDSQTEKDSILKLIFENLPKNQRQDVIDGALYSDMQFDQFKNTLLDKVSLSVVGDYLKNRNQLLDIMSNDSTLLNIKRQKDKLRVDLRSTESEELSTEVNITDPEFNSIIGIQGTGFKIASDRNYYVDEKGSYLYETGSGGYLADMSSKRTVIGRRKSRNITDLQNSRGKTFRDYDYADGPEGRLVEYTYTAPEYPHQTAAPLWYEKDAFDTYDMHNIHMYRESGMFGVGMTRPITGTESLVQNDYTARFGTEQNYFNVGDMIAEVKGAHGTAGDVTLPTFYEFANYYLKDLTGEDGMSLFKTAGLDDMKESWTVVELQEALHNIDLFIGSKVSENDDLKARISKREKGNFFTNWYWPDHVTTAKDTPWLDADKARENEKWKERTVEGYPNEMYGYKKPGGLWGGGMANWGAVRKPNTQGVGGDILDYFDGELFNQTMMAKDKMTSREREIYDSFNAIVDNSKLMHKYEKGRMVLSWLLNGRGFAGMFENANYINSSIDPYFAFEGEDPRDYSQALLSPGYAIYPSSRKKTHFDLEERGGYVPYIHEGGTYYERPSMRYDGEDWATGNYSTIDKNRFETVLKRAPAYQGTLRNTNIPLRSQGEVRNRVYYSGLLNSSPTLHSRKNSIQYKMDNLNRQMAERLENEYGDIIIGDLGISLDSLFNFNDDQLDKELELKMQTVFEELSEGTGKDETTTKAYSVILDEFKKNLVKGNYKFFIEE